MDRTSEEYRLLLRHLDLLNHGIGHQELNEVSTTPIITGSVLNRAGEVLSSGSDLVFTQYGLLAGRLDKLAPIEESPSAIYRSGDQDPRLFFNTAAPSSTFICGSQGSGKSHMLSCLLESCLIPSEASKLSSPLMGLVFHYDSFISDLGGSPFEAAFLSTNPEMKVRVLCAPTSLHTTKLTYSSLDNVSIQPLRINEVDLNTKHMLDLIAVSSGEGPMPLYLHTVNRILREMRLEEQNTERGFSYQRFHELIANTTLSPMQLTPLTQRLDTLESFMPKEETQLAFGKNKNKHLKAKSNTTSIWNLDPGTLTIVDLSCPCVTPETACSLFNICLGLFLEQSATAGRVIALDEAHKFMNSSTEATALTESLLSTIRLQRHLGARIIISTQEPTISHALLDLCSLTIVHRFTSPEWLRSLKGHLAAAAWDLVEPTHQDSNDDDEMTKVKEERKRKKGDAGMLFREIVELGVGQALLFAPSEVVALEKREEGGKVVIKKLGGGFLKIKVRARLTADGGRSVMAS